MIPDLEPIEWAALGWGAALVALIGAYCLVAPALSNYNAGRYLRETKRIEEDEQQRKLMAALNAAAQADAGPGMVPAPVEPERRGGVGEVLTTIARGFSDLLGGFKRTGAGR